MKQIDEMTQEELKKAPQTYADFLEKAKWLYQNEEGKTKKLYRREDAKTKNEGKTNAYMYLSKSRKTAKYILAEARFGGPTLGTGKDDETDRRNDS